MFFARDKCTFKLALTNKRFLGIFDQHIELILQSTHDQDLESELFQAVINGDMYAQLFIKAGEKVHVYDDIVLLKLPFNSDYCTQIIYLHSELEINPCPKTVIRIICLTFNTDVDIKDLLCVDSSILRGGYIGVISASPRGVQLCTRIESQPRHVEIFEMLINSV